MGIASLIGLNGQDRSMNICKRHRFTLDIIGYAVCNLFNFGGLWVSARHHRNPRVSVFAQWSRAVAQDRTPDSCHLIRLFAKTMFKLQPHPARAEKHRYPPYQSSAPSIRMLQDRLSRLSRFCSCRVFDRRPGSRKTVATLW